MQRFLVRGDILWEKSFILRNKEIISQIIRVLRSKIWDKVIFFDGKNSFDCIYEIKDINKKDISFDFIDNIEKSWENDFDINLYQALPNKINKLEYIVQKGVESWISNFIFFRSDRSQKLILTENKIERLKKIINEALEQSWRNIIPQIKVLNNSLIELLNGLQWLSMMNYNWTDWEKNLFFHTKNDNSKNLKDFTLQSNTNLFVWPEWWWNDDEIIELKKIGFHQVYLWNRILRCETVSSVVWFYLGL